MQTILITRMADIPAKHVDDHPKYGFVKQAVTPSAHKIINTHTTDALVYLDVDTNQTPDIAYYPHTGKVGIRHAGGMRDNFLLGSNVAYYQGEDAE